MIGQRNILAYFDKLSNNNVPHFIVFVGSKGCGKTILSKEVAQKISATFTIVGCKVDEIREVINTAYHARDKVLYCIQDADTMRAEAKNGMLKITEEPPKNAWFIMTVQDDSSLLDTIKSRAVVFKLEPYTQQDIIDYATLTKQEIIPYAEIATTPYELNVLNSYGKEFIDYVGLVMDNIAEVEPSNAFKSSDKLSFKNEDEGYDVKLFLKVFCNLCIDRIRTDTEKYSKGVLVTTPYLSKLSRLGVNKQQVYDSWVFDIRSAWL